MNEILTVRWDDFRLPDMDAVDTDPVSVVKSEGFPVIRYTEQPERYVRRLCEHQFPDWCEGEAIICPMDGGPVRSVVIDWSGFPEAVDKYLGKEDSAQVIAALDRLTTGSPQAHDGQNRTRN